ncbi:redoxin family protein [bacterium]|nr:redoxin family protein [bacterium]
MKFRVLILSLACMLVLVGCGHKNTSVKSAKKPNRQTASTSANSPNNTATKPQAANDQSDSGLSFNIQPQTLDQALNPLGALNNNSQASPKGSGIAGNLNVPTKAPAASAPAALPKSVKPKPDQLLALVQMRYRSVKTINITGTTGVIVEADGKVVNKSSGTKSSFVFKRPDKFNVTGSNERMVSDGKVVVRYFSGTKRFAKTKLDKEKQRLLFREMIGSQAGVRSLGLLMGLDYAPMMSSMKLLKDSKVGGRDTYVLSMRIKEGVGCPKGSNAVQTLWIGKKDFVIYRNQLVEKGKPKLPNGFKGKAPKLLESTINVVVTKCVLDANMPDSNFVFSAPAGAKPIEDLTKDYLHGKNAPELAFTWTDGSKKSLADFHGKTVILDCWALPMCEQHLPVLQKIYEKHKEAVQIVSVCVNSDTEEVKKYLSEKSLDFPVVYANEDIAHILRTKYHVQVIPTIFLIDKSGVVQETILGMPPEKDITAKLDKLQ